MLKRRLVSLFLALALLAGFAPASAAGASPYAIRVNRAMNTVTIYEADESGRYTVPVKAMVCSTARPGYVTPAGTYQLHDYRTEWQLMVDGTYGQYAVCFSGNYLFHSICYSDAAHDTMIRDAYNGLGSAASMGCVRLQTEDAKWIFDNCPGGTPVTIYDDSDDPGPLGKPERAVDAITESMYNGWDPTDPHPGNPWNLAPVTALSFPSPELALEVGDSAQTELAAEPADAMVFWSSSDEAVARVDAQGRVTALSAGTAEITARGLNGTSAVCTVRADGELLPFDDLIPGAWYYPELRRALETGLFQGSGTGSFAPDAPMTRAMVVQVLYNLAGKPAVAESAAFADVAEDAWYRDAVLWAAEEQLITGVSAGEFAPSLPMTRQDLAVILWRWAGQPDADSDLSVFSDGAPISGYAQPALRWAVSSGCLRGTDGQLLPTRSISRAETAALLLRYAET